MAAVKSAASARDYRASRRRRAGLTFTFLAVALCAVMVLSAGLGQYNIPTDQVVASVGRRLGLAPENPAMQLADSTLGISVSRVCCWACWWVPLWVLPVR